MVDRNILWNRMAGFGFKGRFLSSLQAIYNILFHRATVLTFSSIEESPHQLEVMHEGSQS